MRRALEKCQKELELCRSGAIEGKQLLEKELTACKTEVDTLKVGGGAQRDALIAELKKPEAAEMSKQMSALTNELEKCKAELKQSKDQLTAQGARTEIGWSSRGTSWSRSSIFSGSWSINHRSTVKAVSRNACRRRDRPKEQTEKFTHEDVKTSRRTTKSV